METSMANDMEAGTIYGLSRLSVLLVESKDLLL